MYTKCIDCSRLGKTCSGPDFYLLSAEELIAWCRRRKEFLRLSNVKIAETANMSRGTVDNLFAGTHSDFRYESIRPILKVLIGKADAEEICRTVDSAEIENLKSIIANIETENAKLKSALANAEAESAKTKAESEHFRTENEYLKSALEHEKRQTEQNTGYLREQMHAMQTLIRTRKRIIYFLFSALMLLLCAVIAVLIYDKLHPEVGWFRGLNYINNSKIGGIL